MSIIGAVLLKKAAFKIGMFAATDLLRKSNVCLKELDLTNHLNEFLGTDLNPELVTNIQEGLVKSIDFFTDVADIYNTLS